VGNEAVLKTECGRAIVALAGALVTSVIGVKENRGKTFVIVDGSMTELLRPSLYQAWHPITALKEAVGTPAFSSRPQQTVEVVGPVCESADVLGSDRLLPELVEGDLVMIGAAGAYGAVMSSTYNARRLPQEHLAE
jgi:diaminopimelate decarboxylase